MRNGVFFKPRTFCNSKTLLSISLYFCTSARISTRIMSAFAEASFKNPSFSPRCGFVSTTLCVVLDASACSIDSRSAMSAGSGTSVAISPGINSTSMYHCTTIWRKISVSSSSSLHSRR